jgi:beta-carotene ketolase (CrtO type)
MADMSFDVVIVGGQKAGVAAMYLTKYGGMSVGLFEERHEGFTGWSGEEAAFPGFTCHQCSHGHNSYRNYHRPLWDDIPEWKEYGAIYQDHILNTGIVTIEDDTWCFTYTRDTDPTQEKTAEIFSRFSQKDADTWLWMFDKIEKYWEPAFLEWAFNPAVPYGQEDAFDRLLKNPDSGIDPLWLSMSPIQFYKDVFESPEVRACFLRPIQSMGVPADQWGMGLFSCAIFIPVSLDFGVVKGGNHQLAHATQRVILENGGKIFTRKPVEKVLIENGRARGIRLEDGTEIEAKKAVLMGVDPYQLVFELVGPEHFDPIDVKRVKNLEDSYVTIGWYTWALHERPKYKAEAFGPDVKYMGWGVLGDKSLDNLINEAATKKMGKLPDPDNLQLIVSDSCTIDPQYAPEGKHVLLTETYLQPAWRFTEKEWKELETRHAREIIRYFGKYAPNMTWDNVIGYLPVTPFYSSKQARNWGKSGNIIVIDGPPSQVGRNRPTPNLASGRMPVEGLYATGSGWHPYGAAHSMQGYCIYKVMAEDFGLQKPWEEKGRPY